MAVWLSWILISFLLRFDFVWTAGNIAELHNNTIYYDAVLGFNVIESVSDIANARGFPSSKADFHHS